MLGLISSRFAGSADNALPTGMTAATIGEAQRLFNFAACKCPNSADCREVLPGILTFWTFVHSFAACKKPLFDRNLASLYRFLIVLVPRAVYKWALNFRLSIIYSEIGILFHNRALITARHQRVGPVFDIIELALNIIWNTIAIRVNPRCPACNCARSVHRSGILVADQFSCFAITL